MHGTGMGVKRRTPSLTGAAAWFEKLATQTVVQNFILRDHHGGWNEATIQRGELLAPALQDDWIFRDLHIQ